MTKSEKNEFLRNGGLLIRRGNDAKGQPIIKARTEMRDWHKLKTFNNNKERDIHFNNLLVNPLNKED